MCPIPAARVFRLFTRSGCAMRAAALVAGLLTQAAVAGAQPGWTGIVTDAPTGLRAGLAFSDTLVSDSAGNLVYIWPQPASSSSTTAIRVARFDAAAQAWAWDQAIELSANGASPAIAMTRSGDATAVWAEPDGTNARRLRAARYSSSSAAWSSAVTVAAGASLYFPRIASDEAGNAVAVWWHANQSVATAKAARYVAATGQWTSPVDITTFANLQSIVSPFLLVDAAGGATAVWSPPAAFGAPTTLQSSRWAAGSPTWSTPVVLATVPGQPTSGSSISLTEPAVDGDGNVLVLWRESTFTAPFTAVRWARYASASASWSAARTFPTQDWAWPSLQIDAAGDATAVWSHASDTASSLFSSSLTAASESWTTPRLLHDRPRGVISGARSAIDDAGTMTVVWVEHGTVSPFVRGSTRALRQTRGGALSAAVTLVEAPEHFAGPSAVVEPSAPGEAMVLFADFRSTRWTTTGAERLSAPLELNMYGADFLGLVRPGNPLAIRWSAPTTGLPVTGYRLEAGTPPGLTDLAVVDLGPTPRLDTRVPAVPTFGVRVRAMSGSIVGPPSNPIYYHVFGVCGAVQAPRGLTATVTGSTVRLTWGHANAAESYLLQAGTAAGLSNIVSTNVGLATGFSAAAPAGTYYVRVRAVDACATSGPSEEVVVVVAGAAAPGAPTLNAPSVSGSTVTLSWSPGSGGAPTGYALRASVTPGGPAIVTVPVTGTSASFSSVPSGTYFLRLIASNASGSSSSAEVALAVP